MRKNSMKKKKGSKDVLCPGVPRYVVWVWFLELHHPFVGSKTYHKIDCIQRAFPSYFPWETKYRKIPKEVHEAFSRECYPERYKWETEEKSEDGIKSGKGILAMIQESTMINPPEPLTEKMLMNFISDMNKIQKDRMKRKKEIGRIWNKHYSKYGIECREREFLI